MIIMIFMIIMIIIMIRVISIMIKKVSSVIIRFRLVHVTCFCFFNLIII